MSRSLCKQGLAELSIDRSHSNTGRQAPLPVVAATNCGAETSFVEWLDLRLVEERLALDARHLDLCDAVRNALIRFEVTDAEVPKAELCPEEIAIAGAEGADAQAAGAGVDIDAPAAAEQNVSIPVEPAPVNEQRVSVPVEPASVPHSRLPRVLSAQAIHIHAPKSAKSVSRLRSPIHAEHHRALLRCVEHPAFEICFGFLIIANLVVMSLEVEFHGKQLREDVEFMLWRVDSQEIGSSWPQAEVIFPAIESFFGVAFTLEVLTKMLALQLSFFSCGFNVFDMAVVVVWCLDQTVGLQLIANPMLLRLVRLLRLARLVRLLRMVQFFDTLVLLVSSIRASVSVLIWGTMVLVFMMTGCALVLNQMLTSSMTDKNADQTLRQELFQFWGTYGRCMVTMFEITMGNWVPACRMLMDNVNEWYGLAFIIYKSVVGFAVVKVITGVFMHETFQCAAVDDVLMIQRRARAKQNFKHKMQELFSESDTSGDGMVDIGEFKCILEDERVNNWLQAMEITINDPEGFFRRIAGPDMLLSNEELTKNMGHNKGAASQIDAITLLENTADLKGSVAGLVALVKQQGASLRALAVNAYGSSSSAMDLDDKLARLPLEQPTSMNSSMQHPDSSAGAELCPTAPPAAETSEVFSTGTMGI